MDFDQFEGFCGLIIFQGGCVEDEMGVRSSLAFLGPLAAPPTRRSAFAGACEGLLALNTHSSHPPDTFQHTHTHQVKPQTGKCTVD